MNFTWKHLSNILSYFQPNEKLTKVYGSKPVTIVWIWTTEFILHQIPILNLKNYYIPSADFFLELKDDACGECIYS